MRELSLSPLVAGSRTVDEPEELTRAKENREQELFLLSQRFPDGRFKKTGRPEKGLTRTRIGERRSKLSVEVMPDDIMTQENGEVTYADGSWGGGWADSSEGWPRLEDEIAENEAAQEAAGITVCWGPWSGQKDPDEEVCHTWKADDEVESTKSADSSDQAADGAATLEGKSTFAEAQDNRSRIDEKADDTCGEHDPCGILDPMLSVGG
ncbi:hypothetical protein Slin15195_G058780 [Septoria linicola]|uniref:Uncharacterized protein n=1 Tax=Septoria linicola TaxID=215465 RepID=A0A9Q9EJT8_9PEZI|nr:hypothetical protein Slin14017_G074640 [Septoria linicola]USW52559.1 hypothetical protein Slin15195_G058780 [Septoria linicola]